MAISAGLQLPASPNQQTSPPTFCRPLLLTTKVRPISLRRASSRLSPSRSRPCPFQSRMNPARADISYALKRRESVAARLVVTGKPRSCFRIWAIRKKKGRAKARKSSFSPLLQSPLMRPRASQDRARFRVQLETQLCIVYKEYGVAGYGSNQYAARPVSRSPLRDFAGYGSTSNNASLAQGFGGFCLQLSSRRSTLCLLIFLPSSSHSRPMSSVMSLQSAIEEKSLATPVWASPYDTLGRGRDAGYNGPSFHWNGSGYAGYQPFHNHLSRYDSRKAR